MRHSEQLPLTAPWIGHVHATELAAMSALLDAEHGLAALVQQDLLARCAKQPRTGRPGLTGDQVLRLALARQLNGWTYAELAFHVTDSASYRTFCRLSPLAPTPSKSALAANLRALRPVCAGPRRCPATAHGWRPAVLLPGRASERLQLALAVEPRLVLRRRGHAPAPEEEAVAEILVLVGVGCLAHPWLPPGLESWINRLL
jgi:hypothetical protein